MCTQNNNSNTNHSTTIKEYKLINNSKTGNSANAPKPSGIVNQIKTQIKEVNSNY